MTKNSLLPIVIVLLLVGCSSPEPPRLVPEQSNFTQTSTYDDVMDVVNYAREQAENMHYEVFGRSELGKELPLLVFSDRFVETPKEAEQLNRPVVFIMANIHGGEVEGKEALLRLILELTEGQHENWLEDITLLLAPIFNADGNDKIDKSHRVNQYGPSGGVGTRANENGLDLNRDFTKLAASETRGVVQNVLVKWNPTLFMDLHTTNGSAHGYHLTYSVPLNPNTDPRIVNFQRNVMMPQIRKKMKQKDWQVFSYGNFREGAPEKGYYTYSPHPRYTTNYIGLRNRLGLLSEAYAYVDFENRIAVTEDFVKATIQFMVQNAESVQSLLNGLKKDYSTFSDTLQAGISYDYVRNPNDLQLLISDLDTVYKENFERNMYKRMGIEDTVTSELYNRFRITERRPVPFAYALDNRSDDYNNILKNLDAHGINYFTADSAREITVRRFEITEIQQADRRYQNRFMNEVSGEFHQEEISLNGWVIIPASNINRPLIFQLLEPEAEDGYVAWNMLRDSLKSKPFPIVKIMEKIEPAVNGSSGN